MNYEVAADNQYLPMLKTLFADLDENTIQSIWELQGTILLFMPYSF